MKRKDIKRRPLSDTALSGLEPEATAYREKDGDGLYFRVKPNGTKSWELRYKKPDGKWSWHGLGGYPDLSGAMAREKAREAKRLVASGTDPVQHKAAQRVAKETACADTFGAAAEYWYQRKAQDGQPPVGVRLLPRISRTRSVLSETSSIRSLLYGCSSIANHSYRRSTLYS